MKIDPIRNKRILVTGGGGVIGCELIKLLLEQDADVLSVDRRLLPKWEWGGITQLQKDLAVDNLDELSDFQPQLIFHLAASFQRTEESSEFWKVNWHDNVLLSHRIIDLARKIRGLEVFVFATSYLVYNPSLYLFSSPPEHAFCLKEDDPKGPRNLCGAAKYYTEKELEFMEIVKSSALRIVSARIYRVYGRGSNDVVSRWVRAVRSGEKIEVYNKQNRFDYIFAGDVAEGLLRIAECPMACGPINLGSGIPQGVDGLLDYIREYIPYDGSKVREVKDEGSFEASCANIFRLKKLTGWVPPTSLKDGVRIIVEYEKEHQKRRD